MKIMLAEALLRRKELQMKVDQLKVIDDKKFYEVKATRKPVHEGIDDIVVAVPKLRAAEVTAERDWYARQLRLIDAAIQQCNWATELEVRVTVMDDFTAKD